jgi:hypothetical protein
MSHDKKKTKKSGNGTQIPVVAGYDSAKGSVNTTQKATGDTKTGVKNSVTEIKIAPKKEAKWKTR